MVASMAGEGHAEGLARLVDELVVAHEAKGTLRRGGGPTVPAESAPTTLRFPGKAAALDGGSFLVADSAHHSLVELAADAATLVRRIGSGTRGRADGGPGTAQFSEPGGLCVLPPRVAELAGYDVVVADTVNHLLRGVRLDTGEVRTVAGSGRQWRGTVDFGTHDALAVDLSVAVGRGVLRRPGGRGDGRDPSAVVVRPGDPHGRESTRVPRSRRCATVRCTRRGWRSRRGCRPRRTARRCGWPTASRARCAGSAVASCTPRSARGCSTSGTSTARPARRCCSIRWGYSRWPAGSVLIADTYNGAVRRYDPAAGTVATVATGLAEPSDLVATATGAVYVVESAAHRLTRIDPKASTSRDGRAPPHRATGDRAGRGRGRARRRLHPAARAEARRLVRSADPAGGVGVAAVAAGGRRRGPPNCPARWCSPRAGRASCRWWRRRPPATRTPSIPRAT